MSNLTYDRADELLAQLPDVETWPLHYVDEENGDNHDYCYPCMKRIEDWLDRFVTLGWITPHRRQEFDSGADYHSEKDTVGHCGHCGAPLEASLTDEGVDMELEHFESCTPEELRQIEKHEIQRLMWHFDQENERAERVRSVVVAYLRAHGLLTDAEASA